MGLMIPKVVSKYLIYVLFLYSIVAGIYLFGIFEWRIFMIGKPYGRGHSGHEPLPPNYDHLRDPDYVGGGRSAPVNPVIKVAEDPAQVKKFRELQDHISEQSKLIQNLQSKITSMAEAQKMSAAAPPTAPVNTPENAPEEFSKLVFSEELPTSSVFCQGNTRDERTCKIKNLCYHPKFKQWFVVKGNTTTLKNVPSDRSEWLIDMTSLSDHGVFFWNYVEVPEHLVKQQQVRLVADPTFILMRFHTGNIMHAMHDDFLGLYFHLKMYAKSSLAPSSSLTEEPQFSLNQNTPFDKNHNILFMDGFNEGGYGHVFKMLTDRPLRFRSDLDEEHITCFTDAVVGQSKRVNWYQYGFSVPQGPIPNKTVSGYDVREVGRYVLKQLHLPTWNRADTQQILSYLKSVINNNIKNKPDFARLLNLPSADVSFINEGASFDRPLPPPSEACIAIFGRRHDRLLRNEADLAASLEETFKLPVKFVRNEDLSFVEQVKVLRTAIIAIGMHGSLLVMGMFLPPGAILIECYPFAVPADNYTPYKTLSRLPGMEITYRSWTNTHQENNIPHPEYPQYHGGLMGFGEEQRNKILSTYTVPSHLCCTDPYWLFRIYQDTVVHIPELSKLVSESVIESARKFSPSDHVPLDITPAPLDEPKCRRVPPVVAGAPARIHIEWQKPWNVDSALVKEYGIWVHQTFNEYRVKDGTSFVMPEDTCINRPDTDLEIWVRSYYETANKTLAYGEWTKKITCNCKG